MHPQYKRIDCFRTLPSSSARERHHCCTALVSWRKDWCAALGIFAHSPEALSLSHRFAAAIGLIHGGHRGERYPERRAIANHSPAASWRLARLAIATAGKFCGHVPWSSQGLRRGSPSRTSSSLQSFVHRRRSCRIRASEQNPDYSSQGKTNAH